MPSTSGSGIGSGLSTKEDLVELDRKLSSKEIDATSAIKLLITALMTVLPSASQTVQSFPPPPVEVKHLVKEQCEEVERGRCLVISGIPEYSSLSASECRKQVTLFITSLLDDLNMSCSIDKFFRMGNIIDGKTRLMKLVLPSSATQRAVLSALKSRISDWKTKKIEKLWSHADASRVFIRPSLSLEHRTRGFALRLKRIRLAAAMNVDKKLLSINYVKEIVVHSITKETHKLSEADIADAKRTYHQRRLTSATENSDLSQLAAASSSSSTETVIAVPSSVNTDRRRPGRNQNSSASSGTLNH